MGEFRAGTWIVGIGLYFFIFFLVVYSSVNAAEAVGLTHEITFNDPGVLSIDPDNTTENIDTSVDPLGTASWSNVKTALSIMSGFNANIGLPNSVMFIFTFLFFWLPALALLWAIYMGIPFLH